MCGAHSGPAHSDPAASELCDAYHGFSRADLPRLERSLDDRQKEIVWQVALGIGPDALAARLGAAPDGVRDEMRALTGHLHRLAAQGAA